MKTPHTICFLFVLSLCLQLLLDLATPFSGAFGLGADGSVPAIQGQTVRGNACAQLPCKPLPRQDTARISGHDMLRCRELTVRYSSSPRLPCLSRRTLSRALLAGYPQLASEDH